MRRLAALIVFMVAVAAAAIAHARLPIAGRAEQGAPFVPRPEVARLSSMGFHTLMSDVYWLRAVQVVGASLRPEDQGTLLGRYVDVVTTVDPWVDHPYRFGALWLTGSEADVRHANRILERSFPYHPDEWRNRFYLGFNLFYHLGEYEAASHWIEEASRLPGAPRYLTGLAARLAAGRRGLDEAEALVREMWSSVEDPDRRKGYEEMLDAIETERRARLLDRARETYRRRFGRDIERVEELAQGPRAVLRRLPPELHGMGWTLDGENGEIVSRFYGRRYLPHHHDAATRRRIYGWSVEDGAGARGDVPKAGDGEEGT